MRNSLIILFFFSLIILCTSATQNSANNMNSVIKSDTIVSEAVVGFGDLTNYVTNNVEYETNGSKRNWYTFRIGEPNLSYPSMNWDDGYYHENHYLFGGSFFVGYNGTCIYFDTKTSNDFFIARWDTAYPSPMSISFSMTDDSAEVDKKVGIKTTCKINCWPEPYRDDYLIYEYIIYNKSGLLLNNLYCALYMDCDVSSAGGGSGETEYFQDDYVNYYLGLDQNGNPESISYMYDSDNQFIDGDDTGGRYLPKESLGYIGSRVLESPSTSHGISANQQSGHQYWHLSDPVRAQFYLDMTKEIFEEPPTYNHDFRYYQTLGPWNLENNDSIRIVFALSVGEGLEGLRSNLQAAYDQYWSGYEGSSVPYILDYSPSADTLIAYKGDQVMFEVNAVDKNGENLEYRWAVNEIYNSEKQNYYNFETSQYPVGTYVITADVANDQFHSYRHWTLNIKSPRQYKLYQNQPNPFNGETKIPFELKEPGKVSIIIYDLLGRKVKTVSNEYFTEGRHEVSWDGLGENGSNVATGLYFYKLKINNFSATSKLLLLR